MRFARVRSQDPACGETCPEWIAAEGWIDAATPERFREFIKAEPVSGLPLVVSSFGGDLEAARQLAHLVRDAGLDVAVGLTLFEGCSRANSICLARRAEGRLLGVGESGSAYCHGACTILLAAGVRRFAGETVTVSTHFYAREFGFSGLSSDSAANQTAKRSTAAIRQMKSWYGENGIDGAVVERGSLVKNGQALAMSPDDMIATRLVTSRDSLDVLANPGICEASPMPANCVRLTR
jgi:hypothetical protein